MAAREAQFLFVYGTLLRHFRHPMGRQLAAHGKFAGDGAVDGRLFDVGAYPAAVRAVPGRGRVRGELYELERPRDLFAVIALRGKPCGEVKSYEKRAENDYLVTCESGHRYRVHVTEDQRVVVEER